MKKLLVLCFFMPFLAKAQFTLTNTSTVEIAEVRAGTWPVDLQRVIKESDTCYLLSFRDQQYTNDVNMSTLKFGNLIQLRYFMKGLVALKNGGTGDEAKFKDYTLKRQDKKKEGVWYTLTCSEGDLTNFLQPEADKLITAIKAL